MKEKALNSIIDLFALLATYNYSSGSQYLSNLLEVYLSSQFSKPTVDSCLDRFYHRTMTYTRERQNDEALWNASFHSELEAQSYIIAREVPAQSRLLVYIYIIEFSSFLSFNMPVDEGSADGDKVHPVLRRLANLFQLSNTDFNDCLSFVNDEYVKIDGDNKIFIITDNSNLVIPGVMTQRIPQIEGQIIFLKFKSFNTILFKVSGESRFEANGHILYKRRTNVLRNGALIQVDGGVTIYYNDVQKAFAHEVVKTPLSLLVSEVEHRFGNGEIGIHEVGLAVKSGELMAVMGGSGSGKTTLMNILVGFIKPTKGTVTLNGVDIHQFPDKVKGHVGYVPQDDALNGNLTAFQNLFYSAGLCLGQLNEAERVERIDNLLAELGLSEIRDLRVGSALDKIISGGQRKRLNIAIELIRDPGILFLDEPTSGLSSSDSENIMQLLKMATFSGKTVIVNIHQPSSDIFKLFDKLLFIDQSGYPVYFGRAAQVVSYLKKALRYVDSHENECASCGNLNPDDIFHLVQLKKSVQTGSSNTGRVYTPDRWHRYFLRLWYDSGSSGAAPDELSSMTLNLPNFFKQFSIYGIRNWLTKLADKQYMAMSLLLPPLLAVILSVFSRYIDPSIGRYAFGENDNVPSYLLMSVIVALFLGMMSSSEEIINDRLTLRRESFLNLSFPAYVMAKLTFLFVLSAAQMWAYVLVGNSILNMGGGMLHAFWVLWTTACFANVLGLVMSSLFKSVATVYVSIPFLLIPQILLSGAVIDFNKINPVFSSPQYVPLAGEGMAAKWAYEALMVDVFINNDYNAVFYNIDKQLNEVSYLQSFLLPEIEKLYYGNSPSDKYLFVEGSRSLKLLNDGLDQLGKSSYLKPIGAFDPKVSGNRFSQYIDSCSAALSTRYDVLQSAKDSLITTMGPSLVDSLKLNCHNKKTNELVTESGNFRKIVIVDDKFVRKLSPIYFSAKNNFFRSHFFAPKKYLGPFGIPTLVFNVSVIWMTSITLIVFLLLNHRRKYR